jgi:UDP-glucose:(heptosyl)LPS alpha-1,3-glucosyltransferase
MNYRLKGLEPLLQALRYIPSRLRLSVIILGSSNSAPYERLARRLGVSDRVNFHGFCAETRNAYFAADFLVHPTFYDPCSLVVLEALACGLPVITSRYNGASELLDPPQAGLLIDDPHDHRRLAGCIEQFCDPARRADAAQAAREAADRWTFDHHYQRMMAVFRLAAERRVATLPTPMRQAC